MVEAETVRSLLQVIERRLEKMAGFRNVLAHVYAEVDPALVHANLERLDDGRVPSRQTGSYPEWEMDEGNERMSGRSTAAGTQGSGDPGRDAALTRRRFNVDEYHAMVGAGILDEDSRVELLDGEIVEMAAIGSRHAGCVNRLTRIFMRRLGDRIVLAPQNPLQLDDYSEPEPDIALLRPRDDLYADAHPAPADALLVVEVADTTVIKDRRIKLPLYARAGVSEVWLVNLDTRELEIYREPSGDAYSEVERVSEGAVHSLAFPDIEIDVGEILGPPPEEPSPDPSG